MKRKWDKRCFEADL